VKKALTRLRREWRRAQQTQTEDYRAHDTLPAGFARALQDTLAAMGEHFAAHPQEAQGPLQQCFFDLAHFARLADSFGPHSAFESMLDEDALAIRNLVPAPFLAPRFADSLSTACFSGTLAPFGFYRDTLGLPEDTATLDVGSPFRSEQLAVRIATDVSTRFRDRARSLDRVVRIMAAQYAAQPGNYLAFFSSFEHLRSVFEAFVQRHPEVPAWAQARGMREPEREAFLARFAAGGRGIGFAVLGGPFGEGIDLPGDRLVGAFIASLGLPQHDAGNEHMRARMEALFGEGYAYTYVYPGLQKVVQAAGRVIRSEQDAGVLYLLDDRYARREIRALLPAWWRVQAMRGAGPSGPSAPLPSPSPSPSSA
jgi:DNA excision repair protein ERCC-2